MVLGRAAQVSEEYPVVMSKFIENAKELEMDAVAQAGVVDSSAAPAGFSRGVLETPKAAFKELASCVAGPWPM